MKPQRVAQPGADVAGVEIGALDARGLGHVTDARDAVPRVHEVAAGLLRDPVLRVRRLALPVVVDGGAAGQAAAGRRFRARPVRRQVDVGRDAACEFRHRFVVRGAVVEEDSDALRGFHHYWGSLRVRGDGLEGRIEGKWRREENDVRT